MDDKMKAFLTDLSTNQELKDEFIAKFKEQSTEATEAINKLSESISDFAKEKGYNVDSFSVFSNTLKLDDSDLEKISGGRVFELLNGEICGDCWCALGGGGVGNKYQTNCGCVGYGQSELTHEGWELCASKCDGTHGSIYSPLICVIGGGHSMDK